MNQIQLAVMDMAGTTVHDEDYVSLALVDALADVNCSISLSAAAAYMGVPKPVAIRELLEEQGKPADGSQVEEVHQRFLQRMIDFYAHHPAVREVEGASKVFQQLREAGIKIVLDTGFSRDITNAILQRLDWTGGALLEGSVASDEVAQGRPFPDMIYKAMEMTGITDVRQVAKIGDTRVDMLQGKEAGCTIVAGVLSGTGKKEELLACGATHILDSIQALPALLLPERVAVG